MEEFPSNGYLDDPLSTGYLDDSPSNGYLDDAAINGYHDNSPSTGYQGDAPFNGYHGDASVKGYHGDASGTWISSLSLNYTLPAMITVGMVLVLVILITAVGNLLVGLALFRYRQLRTISNYLIGNLALSDFLLATTVLPLSTLNECLGHWICGRVMCNIWVVTDVLYCTASLWNICIVALDRFTATLCPIWYREKRTTKQAALYASLVWLIAGAICVPPLLGWNDLSQVYIYDNTTQVYHCILFETPSYVLYSAIGSFFAPFFLTLFLYVQIFIVLHRRVKNMRGNSAGNSQAGKSSLVALVKDSMASRKIRRDSLYWFSSSEFKSRIDVVDSTQKLIQIKADDMEMLNLRKGDEGDGRFQGTNRGDRDTLQSLSSQDDENHLDRDDSDSDQSDLPSYKDCINSTNQEPAEIVKPRRIGLFAAARCSSKLLSRLRLARVVLTSRAESSVSDCQTEIRVLEEIDTDGEGNVFADGDVPYVPKFTKLEHTAKYNTDKWCRINFDDIDENCSKCDCVKKVGEVKGDEIECKIQNTNTLQTNNGPMCSKCCARHMEPRRSDVTAMDRPRANYISYNKSLNFNTLFSDDHQTSSIGMNQLSNVLNNDCSVAGKENGRKIKNGYQLSNKIFVNSTSESKQSNGTLLCNNSNDDAADDDDDDDDEINAKETTHFLAGTPESHHSGLCADKTAKNSFLSVNYENNINFSNCENYDLSINRNSIKNSQSVKNLLLELPLKKSVSVSIPTVKSPVENPQPDKFPGKFPLPKLKLNGSLRLSRCHLPESITEKFSSLGVRRALGKTPEKNGKSQQHRRYEQRELQATIRMAIIIAFFCGMWLGFFVVYVLRSICPQACPVPQGLVTFFFWLGYLNSSVNPILYTIFNEEFRRAFQNILRCGGRRGQAGGGGRRQSLSVLHWYKTNV